MANENVMDRVETLDYLKDRMHTERLVVSRYGDGEYMLMNGIFGQKTENIKLTQPLLLNAIKVKGQLVCIPTLKPHNVEKKDRWYEAQKFLMDISKHSLYGNAMWNVHDFMSNNDVLPFIFSKNVILITGYPDESRMVFKSLQPDLKVIGVPRTNISKVYEEVKIKTLDYINRNKIDNIIFACGPTSGAFIADFINICDANLVDIGSVLNAILNDYTINKPPLIKLHRMSWTNAVDIKKQSDMFFKKLKEIGE